MASEALSTAGKSVGFLARIGWFWIVTFSLLSMIMIHATIIGIENYSQTKQVTDLISPFVWEVGGRLISADEYIYQDIHTLETNPEKLIPADTGTPGNTILRFLSKVWVFWDIISNFWWIYANFKFLYWIWKSINNSEEKFRNAVFAIITMAVIQMLFSTVLLNVQQAQGEKITLDENANKFTLMGQVLIKAAPFKGTIKLFQFFPRYFEGFYDRLPMQAPPIQ